MKPRVPDWFRAILLVLALAISTVPLAGQSRSAPVEELLSTDVEIGQPGGRLVISLRAEPKTLNPLVAADAPSREVIGRMMADLIHIHRASQRTEPALAKSWRVSPDGRQYTLHLRRGLRFSDGHPATADDVVFTFQVYLDEKTRSPQRELLVVAGQPVGVQKLDEYTVRFDLAQPYAAAERLFDSIAVLPRHLLQGLHQEGKVAQAWNLTTPPSQIAGLGPFRLKEYVPGQRIVLERNPFYWKKDRRGNRLPYLNELTFLFVASEDAQVIRFQAGDTDLLSRFGAENFATLEKQQNGGYRLYDLGPGLEYNFLFFNLNDLSTKKLPEITRKQAWFRDLRFRQAISEAVDRQSIVRLVYAGRATPLWSHVTPGNRLWTNPNIPQPPRSLDRTRQLLRLAGFSWKSDGTLVDAQGSAVEFTILTSSSNTQRTKMAAVIQDDLRQLGMNVQVVPIEFRALLDRVFKSNDFEACVLGLGSGDVDPTAEMNVWLSSGSTHLWHLGQTRPATPWEAEIDRLMKEQLTTLSYSRRKRLYDRVQRLVAENLPMIFLASPNTLVGARSSVGNFRPAILDSYTLWNADELFVRPEGLAQKQ